ncbi:MAG: hypothetical protein EA384_14065 [Spirochaetaceae bacterium]|nr:MAG: hypothetical protein EA384_14065 [Spirochaetaceae bacterium]
MRQGWPSTPRSTTTRSRIQQGKRPSIRRWRWSCASHAANRSIELPRGSHGIRCAACTAELPVHPRHAYPLRWKAARALQGATNSPRKCV